MTPEERRAFARFLNTVSLALGEWAEEMDQPAGIGQSSAGEAQGSRIPPASPARPAAVAGSPPPSGLPDIPMILEEDFDAILTASGGTEVKPEGHLVNCPKHRKPFRDGKFGLFCASQTDDPAWGKARDGKLWCSITPKNAAKWLQIQAAVPA